MRRQRPEEIERESFAVIRRELGRALDPALEPVVLRVIHTTADFDYADNLLITREAVAAGVEALRAGADIACDTSMVMAGINKRALAALGGRVHCFIGEAEVAAEAAARGITRSAVCAERAAALDRPLVWAAGNAPTFLLRLHELIEAGAARPLLVIAAPVGFVNVVESKAPFERGGTPAIVARGRKGGSSVAAAICNALLYLARDGR